MSDCYIVRHGGGAGLNFSVVGNPKPASPAENTIWIDTDVPITGYAFAVEPPELKEGAVYINTGLNPLMAFNALRKNSLMVYPASASQMVGGVLVPKSAEIYRDGAWIPWIRYIYDNGNEIEKLLSTATTHAAVTKNPAKYYLSYDIPSNTAYTAGAHIYTDNSIKLNTGNVIVVEFSNLYTYTDVPQFFTGIVVSVIPYGSTPSIDINGDISGALAIVKNKQTSANNLSGTLELPIVEKIEGRIAVTLGCRKGGYSGRNNGSVNITKILVR